MYQVKVSVRVMNSGSKRFERSVVDRGNFLHPVLQLVVICGRESPLA